MNIELARVNMLTQQLRAWDVLDQEILALVATTPREHFVPAGYENLAFADMNIPLTHGQVMLTPKEEARILQALKIQPSERVLEIGTGSGYMTALLARQAMHVDSVDIFASFTQEAAQKLALLNIANATLFTGDAAHGWKGTYEVIVVTGSLPYLPTGLQQDLPLGGRLFATIGTPPVMEATLCIRHAQNHWQEIKLFETSIPPLLNAAKPTAFIF